ncbi:hypothetical protein ACPOL_6934 (plasmid) [Acidisarcina polymorpha]|uniref:Uncharacterized protein n=1 Tax=Acidisarcina polymorpha TaxID=2211140 RepID=A0A2Z5GBR8_9BACT|nr:hypothetical protein ACPOL_6908 [Acidisarcina polymorpha]AXC16138.1 hypothetical protein ACPOL_6934 [Acidisarcina polymorpha]
MQSMERESRPTLRTAPCKTPVKLGVLHIPTAWATGFSFKDL